MLFPLNFLISVIDLSIGSFIVFFNKLNICKQTYHNCRLFTFHCATCVWTNTLFSNIFLLCRFCFFESKALLQCWSECSQSWWKENPVPELQLTTFLPPLPLLSPKVAFRCKISRHMERRSFSSPPKDSDCMTNHVHHHPPNPTQNLQTTASLEWKKEFLQLCRVKLRLLSLLNYSIVG